MSHRNNFDPLGAQLRREARENSPPFSPLLHERVMRSILSAPRSVVLAPVRSRATPVARWRWPVYGALAAATALAFLLHHHWSVAQPPVALVRNQPAGPSRLSVAAGAVPPVPQVSLIVATLLDPATQRLQAARYAYLDRDARRLTRYMIDQADVLPSRP